MLTLKLTKLILTDYVTTEEYQPQVKGGTEMTFSDLEFSYPTPGADTNKKQENKTKRSQQKEIKRLFVAVLEWWRLLVASLRYRTKQKFIWKQILYFLL